MYWMRAGAHFFLIAKGIGQMMAEKSISSEASKAKHTASVNGAGTSDCPGDVIERTGVVELLIAKEKSAQRKFPSMCSARRWLPLTVIVIRRIC
jgi:hypothetical protein